MKNLMACIMLCLTAQAAVQHADKAADKLKGKGVEVVKVYAEWCGFCKMIKQDFENLAKNHPHVAFIEVLGDKDMAFAKEHNVTGFPTFLIFKDGKKVDAVVGANIKGLEEKIKQHTQSAPVKEAKKEVKEQPKKEVKQPAKQPVKKADMPEKKRYVRHTKKHEKKDAEVQENGKGCRNECSSCGSCKTC